MSTLHICKTALRRPVLHNEKSSQTEYESIDQLEVERTRVLQAESQRKVNDYLGCK